MAGQSVVDMRSRLSLPRPLVAPVIGLAILIVGGRYRCERGIVAIAISSFQVSIITCLAFCPVCKPLTHIKVHHAEETWLYARWFKVSHGIPSEDGGRFRIWLEIAPGQTPPPPHNEFRMQFLENDPSIHKLLLKSKVQDCSVVIVHPHRSCGQRFKPNSSLTVTQRHASRRRSFLVTIKSACKEPGPKRNSLNKDRWQTWWLPFLRLRTLSICAI